MYAARSPDWIRDAAAARLLLQSMAGRGTDDAGLLILQFHPLRLRFWVD